MKKMLFGLILALSVAAQAQVIGEPMPPSEPYIRLVTDGGKEFLELGPADGIGEVRFFFNAPSISPSPVAVTIQVPGTGTQRVRIVYRNEEVPGSVSGIQMPCAVALEFDLRDIHGYLIPNEQRNPVFPIRRSQSNPARFEVDGCRAQTLF